MPQFKKLRLVKSDTAKKFGVHHIYEYVSRIPEGTLWKVWDYRDERPSKCVSYIQKALMVYLDPEQIKNLMTGMTVEIEIKNV